MKVLVAILGLCSVAAYSSDLSEKEAGDALNAWLQKSKVSLVVKMGRVGASCADHASGVFDDNPEVSIEYKAAQSMGWIKVTRDGSGFWKIEPAGLNAAVVDSTQHNHHYVANGCDYHFAYIPIADRNLVEVLSVKQLDQGNDVMFRWKWVLTPEGKKLSAELPLALLADTDWRLNNTAGIEPGGAFTLMDVSRTMAVREEQVLLKRDNNEWTALTKRVKFPPLDVRSWNWLTDTEIAQLDEETRTSWAEAMGFDWRVTHPEHEKWILFSTASSNGVLKSGGRASVVLVITCGTNRLIKVSSGEVATGRVRLTFDDAAPIYAKWNQLDDDLGGESQPLLKQLVTARTFRVEFTPLGGVPQTAIFNMADFKELFMREKETCHL